MKKTTVVAALCFSACMVCPFSAQNVALPPGARTVGSTQNEGKKALAMEDYPRAKEYFSAQLQAHPADINAKLGLADAELGLTHYESAETYLREVTAAKPELWQAHKNLVVVEAALRRWEDFDIERTVLRLARQRGAPGISTHESDVIDGFTVRGQRWIVREYFDPVGRSQTRYNFEHFSQTGKAQEYVSLDAGDPFAAPGDAVVIGAGGVSAPAKHFTLNWITGKAHGTIKSFGAQEPSYELVRAAVLRWLRARK